jgi:hypothetical protein
MPELCAKAAPPAGFELLSIYCATARKLPSSVGVASLGELKMIRKLATGEYRLYSRAKNPKTGKRRNPGTFKTRAAAEKHEREVQYFKRQGR